MRSAAEGALRREAVVGESEGYWLDEGDFVATDGCSVWSLGPLVFPRNWPEVYRQSPALKKLIGKRGLCAVERVAVVGAPDAGDRAGTADLAFDPLNSFANAVLLEKARGMQVQRGWAIFERRDEPEGAAFVAERYWWNALPEGKWVDFTPRPRGSPELLLASAADGAPKSASLLSESSARLAEHLLRTHVGAEPAPRPPAGAADGGRSSAGRAAGGRDSELEALRAELASATREADAACRRLRLLEAAAPGGGPDDPLWQGTIPESDDLPPGSLVRIVNAEGATDLVGQEATVLGVQPGRSEELRVMLRTGEEHVVRREGVRLRDKALAEPSLSTFGCEITGNLPPELGGLPYNLWPLVYSGVISVRVPDDLLARLNAQFDTLYSNRSTPSHAMFLQGEMKEGKQFTVRNPDDQYKELLLGCAEKLGTAILGPEGATEFKYVMDQVWTVHQMAGDYNPMHFHENAKSHFGFSSFLHLQLPPQLSAQQQRQPRTGAKGHHDGVTSFVWKVDSGMAEEQLESPGVLECELREGYLYVFPQWVQHLVWPFTGPGERRTVAANVALVARNS